MMTIKNFMMILGLTTLVAWGCSSLDPISPGPVGTGAASFARFHAVGDNYTAGMQNGGLVEGFQRATWAAVLAQAAKAPAHAIPTISENGIPQLMYVSDFSVPTIDVLPDQGEPTNTTYPGIYHNLGIPGATLNQLLNQDASFPVQQNPFFGIVLRNPGLGSAVTQAAGAQPSLLAVWAGWMDAFGGASKGTNLALTPPASFEADYRSMMDTFAGAADAVVAANLPGMTDLPYFSTLPPVVVNPETREPVLIGGNPVPLIGIVNGSPGQLPLTSLVLLPAAPLMRQGTGIPTALGGTGEPLPDTVIVDPTERADITTTIGQYNTVIDTVCENRGIPVVDMEALFERMSSTGFDMRGETYTSAYLESSLFGVDGLHPNSIGYYVIALEFIGVINASFGAAIPPPPLPLGVYRNPGLGSGGSAATAAATISPKEWEGLLRLMRPTSGRQAW